MTREQYKEYERDAVSKGAKLLDKILPGWHNQINLDKLDMTDGTLCMMGQLFGGGVEAKLARHMYPNEMKEAEYFVSRRFGWYKALNLGRDGIIPKAVAKTCTPIDEEFSYVEALRYVCDGRNTKCLWAEEIATRKAAEAETSDGK